MVVRAAPGNVAETISEPMLTSIATIQSPKKNQDPKTKQIEKITENPRVLSNPPTLAPRWTSIFLTRSRKEKAPKEGEELCQEAGGFVFFWLVGVTVRLCEAFLWCLLGFRGFWMFFAIFPF